MGRPSLGAAGRTITGSVKISANERRALEVRAGTVHAGLRNAIDAYLGVHNRTAKTEEQVHLQETLDGVSTKCRVHRSWVELRHFYDKGDQFVERRCADCGETTVSRVRSK